LFFLAKTGGVISPKAKVRGSNPLGRASKINGLEDFSRAVGWRKLPHSYHPRMETLPAP